MSIATYAELKVAVEQKWPHRTNLSTFSEDFITLGEAHLNRVLRCREMETRAAITLSTSNNYAALPTGYMELISFTDDLGDELTEVSSEELEAMRYGASATRPQHYLISSRIEFERVADQAYSYTMWHFKKLNIVADSTNAVLSRHPDIYLYASLVQAEAFIKNDGRIALWKEALNQAVAEANNQARRSKRTLRTEMAGSRSNIIKGG